MKRIAVIGSCGAGKSTLSRMLGEQLDLPVIHLDAYYWQPGWQESKPNRWLKVQQGLIKGDRWIIDGNYTNTMHLRLNAADTVIWLDFNRYLCMWQILKRYLQYAGETRPDMAKGCLEKLHWDFLLYVWNFPNAHRSKIAELLTEFSSSRRIIILGNPSQLSNLLQKLDKSSQRKRR